MKKSEVIEIIREELNKVLSEVKNSGMRLTPKPMSPEKREKLEAAKKKKKELKKTLEKYGVSNPSLLDKIMKLLGLYEKPEERQSLNEDNLGR